MFERPYLRSVKLRIKEPRKLIQVILGPHQVGKARMATQLLSQLPIPNIIESTDAISAINSAWLAQVCESARLRLKVSEATEFLLVIDEIQKILGQLQDAGNTTTLANYLRLLSDCGLLGGLDKYAGDLTRKRDSSPKFQVYNKCIDYGTKR